MTALTIQGGALVVGEPSILRHLKAADYHADPCPTPSLSSSIGFVLTEQSPRHAWTEHPRLNLKREPEHKREFDIGTVAHALMLGDHAARFHIVDAPDWRTKAAQTQRVEAYEAGLTPLLQHQADEVAAMVHAGQLQLREHEYAHAFADGTPEVSLFWQEDTRHGPIWCRCRLDFLPRLGGFFPDYKSTGGSAHPEAFRNYAWDRGFYFQAAFYKRAIRKLLDVPFSGFRFVVQETYPPYALSVCQLTPGVLARGEESVEEAIDLWGWCLKHDAWPGYPNKVAYIDEVPLTVERRLGERKSRRMLAEQDGVDYRRLMLDWQRPL